MNNVLNACNPAACEAVDPSLADGSGTPGAAAQPWTRVCEVSEIPMLGARVVQRAGDDDVAVFRTRDDAVFAVVDRCPHKGGPLSAGLVHGRSVTCPLHGWAIDLDSGHAQAPDEGCARTIATRVQDNVVYLALSQAQ